MCERVGAPLSGSAVRLQRDGGLLGVVLLLASWDSSMFVVTTVILRTFSSTTISVGNRGALATVPKHDLNHTCSKPKARLRVRSEFKSVSEEIKCLCRRNTLRQHRLADPWPCEGWLDGLCGRKRLVGELSVSVMQIPGAERHQT